MKIVLNGQGHEIVAPLSLAQLLATAGYADRRVAVEVNGEIVPRSQHAKRVIDAGDHVEIVHAIGGG
jgi:sulfur carrier protein